MVRYATLSLIPHASTQKCYICGATSKDFKTLYFNWPEVVSCLLLLNASFSAIKSASITKLAKFVYLVYFY